MILWKQCTQVPTPSNSLCSKWKIYPADIKFHLKSWWGECWTDIFLNAEGWSEDSSDIILGVVSQAVFLHCFTGEYITAGYPTE